MYGVSVGVEMARKQGGFVTVVSGFHCVFLALPENYPRFFLRLEVGVFFFDLFVLGDGVFHFVDGLSAFVEAEGDEGGDDGDDEEGYGVFCCGEVEHEEGEDGKADESEVDKEFHRCTLYVINDM